jgi:hypothetical protein
LLRRLGHGGSVTDGDDRSPEGATTGRDDRVQEQRPG